MKEQDARVFTKNADYIKSNLDMFLEATLKSNKPKSLIHMGRNISKASNVYNLYMHMYVCLFTCITSTVCMYV